MLVDTDVCKDVLVVISAVDSDLSATMAVENSEDCLVFLALEVAVGDVGVFL